MKKEKVKKRYDFEVNGLLYSFRKDQEDEVMLYNFSENYKGDGHLKVPRKVCYNDITYTVSKIQNAAFFENKKIRSVYFPSNITEIGHLAFAICDNLTSVTFENPIYNIGWLSFVFCPKLDYDTIPDNENRQDFINESMTELLYRKGNESLLSFILRFGDNFFRRIKIIQTFKIGGKGKDLPS